MKNKLCVLQEHIKKYSSKFKKPKLSNRFKYTNINSWFKIKERTKKLFKNKTFRKNNLKMDFKKIKTDSYYTRRFKLNLKEWQKKIMIRWMNAYILMFNCTVYYYKKNRFNKQPSVYNIKELKSLLKKEKNKIHEWSKLNINNKNIFVDKHLLDYAINDSLNRYKSCLTNLKNGNIKHFRLRYLKLTKPNKIIKIEKLAFKNNCFYVRTFKKIDINVKNFNFNKNIITTSIVKYDKKNNSFYLLIKYKHKTKKDNGNKNLISLDPGIRIPFTGYSNNKIVYIGSDVNKKLKKKLKRIDNIMNNATIGKKRKDKLKCKKYKEIKNKIDDFHWKSINYLINNNNSILIGNLSTKKIGENDHLDKMTKRIGNLLRLYVFKQRLKYKCYHNKTKFKEVDEAYTTKTCCNCGNYNKNLKGEKVYKCCNCNLKIDRDINGSMNILLKNILL